ncbi:MAG: hypothetical protein ACOC32_01375 [Nanoarchaeota archaeon]
MIRHIRKLFRPRDQLAKKDLEKLKDNIAYSFSNMKGDIEEQKKWINYLHTNHKDLHASHQVLHGKHDHHQKIHHTDITNINRWIQHLHDTSRKQEEALQNLENNISQAFDKYNKYLVDLFRVVNDLSTTKQQTTIDVQTRPETRLDAQESASHMQDYNSSMIFEDEKPPIEHYATILTRAEKNVLAELVNTSQKLSYKDIAMVSNLSANTVKNHVCHIKNKGFPIKELTDRNGIKRYFVPENIKKVLVTKRI